MSERIGDIAEQVEFYLCERELDPQRLRTLDYFYYNAPVSNQQLKKMADRSLTVSSAARWLDRANQVIPGGSKHRLSGFTARRVDTPRNIYDLLTRTPVHLKFTDEEEQLGREGLKRLGVAEGMPFICFASRDSAYLDAVYPGSDWRYHDYRDCSIHNYVPAAEELTNRGYFAFRMGAVVREALATVRPGVIDYASSGRSDFLDVYLAARCSFFLTSGTGIDSVATVFRRPVACANLIPMGHPHTWGPQDLFILKKLKRREDGQLLTFRKTIDCGADRFFRSDQFEQLAVDVVENTSEEITALAIEMHKRLTGEWDTTREDVELQAQFWSIVAPKEIHQPFLPRVGAHFLRENQRLLA